MSISEVKETVTTGFCRLKEQFLKFGVSIRLTNGQINIINDFSHYWCYA